MGLNSTVSGTTANEFRFTSVPGDLFFHYLIAGASYGEGAYESPPLASRITVWIGEPLYRPYASPAGK